MNPTNTSKNIKPIFPHTVHIQNIHQYNDFRRKRPSKALNFKFVAQEKSLPLQQEISRKSQIALLRTIRLVKPIQNVDLTEFKINAYYLKHARTLSIFKGVSKVKTISTTRYQHHHELKNTFAEEWVKYLTRVTHLTYNMRSVGLSDRSLLPENQENTIQVKDPLKYLRCCRKIQSLEIDACGNGYLFSKTFMRFNQYPALKQLAIKAPIDAEEIDFTQERFQNLESLHLTFGPDYEPEFVLHNIQALSTLPNLKGLSLHFQKELISAGIDLALIGIAEKRVLKKLKLNFDFNCFSDGNVLKSLQHFSQLTDFALNINTENQNLPLVYESLRNKIQLENLDLKITSNAHFQESKDFVDICQTICTFEALRHLKLEIKSEKQERTPSFIPHLKPLFKKPIKLETFSLKANQLDPAEAYPQIIDLLNNSTKKLEKLTIDLGSYCAKVSKKQQIFLDFLERLENIRVLRLPGLETNSQNYLYEVVGAVSSLKHLRRLELGEIKNGVVGFGALAAVETIIKKKGIKKFNCLTSTYINQPGSIGGFGGSGFSFGHGGLFLGGLGKERPPINIKKVMERNPYLQYVEFKYLSVAMEFFKELYQWT